MIWVCLLFTAGLLLQAVWECTEINGQQSPGTQLAAAGTPAIAPALCNKIYVFEGRLHSLV